MLKTLAAVGLVKHELRRGARLTPAGEHLALYVLRRHRVLELFLVDVLGTASDLICAVSANKAERALTKRLRPLRPAHGMDDQNDAHRLQGAVSI